MWRRLADWIDAELRPGVFVPLLAAALLATWYGLGPSLTRILAETGARFVDMQPAVDAAGVLGQLRAYSAATTRFYLGWLVFDFAWPLLSYSAMLFIAAWFARRAPPPWRARFTWLVAVGYTTVLMDWGENVGFGLIVAMPTMPDCVASVAVLCHRAKLALNGLFNIGFLVLAAVAAAHSWSRRHG
jgi:hypothetical protein